MESIDHDASSIPIVERSIAASKPKKTHPILIYEFTQHMLRISRRGILHLHGFCIKTGLKAAPYFVKTLE